MYIQKRKKKINFHDQLRSRIMRPVYLVSVINNIDNAHVLCCIFVPCACLINERDILIVPPSKIMFRKIFWLAHLVLMANVNSDGSTEPVNPCEVITLTNSSDL